MDQILRLIESQNSDQIVQVFPQLRSQIEISDASQIGLISEAIDQFVGSRSANSAEDPNWKTATAYLLEHLISQQERHQLEFSDQVLNTWESVYRALPVASNLRNYILALLVTCPTTPALSRWKLLLCQEPPQYRLGIAIAFAPLLRSNISFEPSFFDDLLAHAIGHLPVAAAVLDLANFAFRNQRVESHPAISRAAQLTELLGHLVQQMARIEEGNAPAGQDPQDVSQTVSDAVALIIPLCDAIGLMKYHEATGKLLQVLELRHRRLQTEAAAALARMEDENGKNALIGLAEHANVRLRVLAYSKELGFEDEISLEHRGEISIAESHLVTWLAEPAQMGIAPSDVELHDCRDLSWPSYDHPVQCYLMKFRYGTQLSNVGIVGPVTHAFSADISHLDLSEQYAAFAGWQTVHEEIFVLPIERARQALAGITQRLESRLDQVQRDEVIPWKQFESAAEPVALGGFFGEYQLVVTAPKVGTLILDDHGHSWFDSGSDLAPIEWELALEIWRGIRLLKNFNPDERFQLN